MGYVIDTSTEAKYAHHEVVPLGYRNSSTVGPTDLFGGSNYSIGAPMTIYRHKKQKSKNPPRRDFKSAMGLEVEPIKV